MEGEGEEEEVVGYEVRLKVGDLEQGEEYVFAVAAGSAIGLGDFSDPSDPYSLEGTSTFVITKYYIQWSCAYLTLLFFLHSSFLQSPITTYQ